MTHTNAEDRDQAGIPVRTAGFDWPPAAFGIFIGALALLMYGYRGIAHDAQLYTLQVLAYLNPELLGHDIFLRFGSQDNFTVFTPLYAQLVARMGLEPAASLVTFVSLFAFLFSAWSFARKVASVNVALLGVALLVALPNDYGSNRIFHLIENFATPRIAAQALVLAALAAYESNRRYPTALWLIAALLLHPLLAVAGILFIFLRSMNERQIGYVIIGSAALMIIAALFINLTEVGHRVQFDDFWFLYGANRVPYLLIDNWNLADWSAIVVTFFTLFVALTEAKTEQHRRIFLAAWIIGAAGIAATAIGGDWLRIALIVQGQPWRTLWLAGAIAVLSLPIAASTLWETNQLGRAVVILLTATWLLRGEVYGFQVGLLTMIAYTFYKMRLLSDARRNIVLVASVVALIFAVGWCAVNNAKVFGRLVAFTLAPRSVNIARGIAGDGLLPLLLVGVMWVLLWKTSLMARRLLAAASIALTTLAIPIAAREWTRLEYPEELKQQFTKWREIIPPKTEVLWANAPLATWILLERPGYMSAEQSASALFSRAAALELNERAGRLAEFIVSDAPPRQPPSRKKAKPVPLPPPPPLAVICAHAPLTYLITSQKLDTRPVDTLADSLPAPYGGLNLYRCPHSN